MPLENLIVRRCCALQLCCNYREALVRGCFNLERVRRKKCADGIQFFLTPGAYIGQNEDRNHHKVTSSDVFTVTCGVTRQCVPSTSSVTGTTW
jgi:hypothetical protein